MCSCRQTIGCRSASVLAIATAGAIPRRCSHSTKHLKYEPRRREAMKFAPASKFGDFFIENDQQLQYFMEFCKIDIFMRGGSASFSASPVGRMLHLIDPGHHHNQMNLEKIRIRDASVHVSRNSRLNDRKISTPWRPIVRKFTLGPVLLYKPTALRVT